MDICFLYINMEAIGKLLVVIAEEVVGYTQHT